MKVSLGRIANLRVLKVLLQPQANRLPNQLFEVGELEEGPLQFNRSVAQAAVCLVCSLQGMALTAVQSPAPAPPSTGDGGISPVQWECRLPHHVSVIIKDFSVVIFIGYFLCVMRQL